MEKKIEEVLEIFRLDPDFRRDDKERKRDDEGKRRDDGEKRDDGRRKGGRIDSSKLKIQN